MIKHNRLASPQEHRSTTAWTLTAILVLAVSTYLGCDSVEKLSGPKLGRHRITITQLALSDSDFGKSLLGNPLPIAVSFSRDGQSTVIAELDGFRGPISVNAQFECEYSRDSRYEFKIEERGIVSASRVWNLSSFKPGGWIFSGQHPIGNGSSVTFHDEPID